MSDTLFTILLPIHRPPAMLPYAVESVLRQTDPRFKLWILCDGAPPETVLRAQDLAAGDDRITVFAFEKGARHGEEHRHALLANADTEFVAQIADDDLWLPQYLEKMGWLLGRVDFGNLPQVDITPEGEVQVIAENLGHESVRNRMLSEMWNIVGPSSAGYRLDAYRKLPIGWSPAPPDIWSDLFMWRKFLAMPDFRFATLLSVQSVKISAYTRGAMTLEQRAEEVANLAERMKDPLERSRLQVEALELLAAGQFTETERLRDAAMMAAQKDFERQVTRLQHEHQMQCAKLEAEQAQERLGHAAQLDAISHEIESVRGSALWPLLKAIPSTRERVSRMAKLATYNREREQ